jgi:hypothetical protein
MSIFGLVRAREVSSTSDTAGDERVQALPTADLAAAVVVGSAGAIGLTLLAFTFVAATLPHTERLEAVEWLSGLVVAAPLGVLLVGRLLAITQAPERRAQLRAAGPLVVALSGATLLAARSAFDAPGPPIPLPWSLMALLLPWAIVVASRRREWVRAVDWVSARATGHAVAAPAAIAIGGAFCIAAFLPTGWWTRGEIVLALALVATAIASWDALCRVRLSRSAHVALGVLVPAGIALLAWDVAFRPLPDHQDFYLGPANAVQHGGSMLVDVYSQYGVVVIDFLAAILHPIGYGTFVLTLGVLGSIQLMTVYLVARVGTGSLTAAAATSLIAFIAGPIATIGSVTQYPSVGFLRFGVTWLLVGALVMAYRNDARGKVFTAVAYGLLGLSAVWSFEAAFYSLGTFAAVVVTVGLLADARGTRLRAIVRDLALGCLVMVAAVAIFSVATYIASGHRPRPRGYLDYLRLYSSAGFGTLPIPDWSFGYLMGGAYVLSLVAVTAICLYGRGSDLARPSRLVPIVATTAFGMLALTYFVGRSDPNNLTHVAAPFVTMIALWAFVAWRWWQAERAPVALAALLLVVWSACLLFQSNWRGLTIKAPDSALATLAKPLIGQPGLVTTIRTLTSNPVVNTDAAAIEDLVRRTVPPHAPLLIAVDPNLSTEALLRLGRSNVLPISDPNEDALTQARRASLIADAAAVPCGTYVVTQSAELPPPSAFLAPPGGTGSDLIAGVIGELRATRRFEPVDAAGPSYFVSRLPC